MTSTSTTVAPRAVLGALTDAIAAAKGGDPLAAVVVAVPTNTCGVMTRRALGRAGGLVGVDMVTINRLAELIAGPGLAAADRTPVSTPVEELAVAAVLERQPGVFGPVADHPSTITALRRLHAELRLAGPERADALAAHSRRGREAVRVSRAVTDLLGDRWYDEADLFTGATAAVRLFGSPVRSLIVHLPQELPALAARFIDALAATIDVHIVDTVSPDTPDTPDTVDADSPDPITFERELHTRSPIAVVSTTDADDEVRHAVRVVVDAARRGTPLERIAICWPDHRPYARLVEHHLDAAGVRWNGHPGTSTIERLAPRLVLDLLDVDRRGLRRRSVFELLADVPARGADGEHLPTAEWERVSREAGIARDDDWNRRLNSLAGSPRWAASATSLAAFIVELRRDLGHPSATRPWAEWSAWCHAQIERWLGRSTIDRLAEPEYRAYESLARALDRLTHLDDLRRGPVTRHRFRATLEAELDSMPGRQGRVGDGVTVGPLAGAVGLDVDVTVVLGAADGQLPPTPTADPLLSDADRIVAGLPTAESRAIRQHRALLAAIDTSDVTVTYPRGDLRATARLLPSRWIEPWLSTAANTRVASHHHGLGSTEFPATTAEHRLRNRSSHVRRGEPIATADGVTSDVVLSRGLECIAGRRSDGLTVYDGDLSGIDVPRLDHPVSPTRLESWVACPHAYFMRYLLGVRPVEEPDSVISITALDRGSAHHDTLDMFHRAVLEGELPQPTDDGWRSEHRAALITYFDQICERTERRGRTGRRAFWADERARMLAELLDWLDHDSDVARARRATVRATEHRFGDGTVSVALPNGRKLLVEGSIDRVDQTSDGTLVVTDHKTGKNKFAKLTAEDPTLGATLFQLPAYAAAARVAFGTHDTEVQAEYSMFRIGGFAREGVRFDAAVDQRVGEQLAAIVEGIEAGYFPNRPQKPGWRLYVDCEYCEPDHLGTADRWADWQRKRHDPRLALWFGDPADDPPAAAAATSGPVGEAR